MPVNQLHIHFRSPFCLLLAVCFVVLLTGCTKSYSPDAYSPGGIQQANKVDRAIVKSVREIDVDDPSLGLGAAGGAATGGLVGSQIGNGSGNAFATLGGVVVGGVIGHLIEQEASATTAYEYILEKPNGDLMTLAQKQDEPIPAETRVLILYGEKARIIPDTLTQKKPSEKNKNNKK